MSSQLGRVSASLEPPMIEDEAGLPGWGCRPGIPALGVTWRERALAQVGE
jgi:hypothetical protein